MALTEGIDRACFLGDDGANENAADITGLQSAGSVVEKTLTQANKVKGDQVLAAFVDLVDGKHAATVGDLRLVLAVGAHTLWATTIHAATVENQTIAQFLAASGLTGSVRGGIETATTNGKFGAFVGRARGLAGAGVAALWASARLTRDPYSGAAGGEVALNLSTYWAFGLPRATNFARVKFVT